VVHIPDAGHCPQTAALNYNDSNKDKENQATSSAGNGWDHRGGVG
jgi:hypothetical protein